MKTISKQGRQGDVGVFRVEKIPAEAQPRKREEGRVILARGEATGHHHSFGSRLVNMYAVADDFTRLGVGFIKIEGRMPAPLQHQEHGPHPFAPGDYVTVRQAEYIEGELRSVAD